MRAAQIAFVLAKLEGYENPFEICTLTVFHELEECRIGDLHKVAKDWIERAKKELKTESARRLLEGLESSDSNEWWITLKKFLGNPRL